jgi:ATP-dependent DNA helicase RecQ
MNRDTQGTFGRAEDVLRRHWGFDTFRPGQREVVADVLAGEDVLGVLPTGAGKSVCYQVPAVLAEGLTLVVSPLVALMADQVAGLSARGIPATWLGSDLSFRDSERRWDDLLAGRYRLLYVAPERLSSERFRARAARLDVVRVAVDEAHCVSEWGHDFRPDYLRIPEAHAALGSPQLVAVTATATPPVRRDIVRLLGLREPAIHVHGFDRPNITWSVFTDPDKPSRLAEVLRTVPGGGIVYASTRRGVEEWAERLGARGESVAAYHAGLPPDVRRRAQEAWTGGRTRLMVATSAFGMGIDRADVRVVVHVDPSTSLESYYQEAGRAGRDGHPAHAVLLVDDRDRRSRAERIRSEHPDAAAVRKVFDLACSMAGIAVGSRSEEPFPIDEGRLGELTGLPRPTVRKAVELLERQGCWARVRLPGGSGLLRMHLPPPELAERAREAAHGGMDALVDALLRTVPADAWSVPWALDPAAIGRHAGQTADSVAAGLSWLADRRLVEWQPPDRAGRWALTGERPARPGLDASAIRRSRRRAEDRFRDLLAYADALGCRRRFLLAYFGESSPDRCGRCDYCMGRHEPYVPVPPDEDRLRSMLQAVSDGNDPGDAGGLADVPAWRRRSMVEWLVREGLLVPDTDGSGRFGLTVRGHEALADPARDQGRLSAFSRSTTAP